jgi:hypothetical protein
MKADSCRFCKLRPVIGKVYEPYSTATSIYFDVLFFISIHRLRNKTPDNVIALLDGAIIYSMTTSILLKILERASIDGQSEVEAISRMERYLVGFTEHLWAEIH